MASPFTLTIKLEGEQKLIRKLDRLGAAGLRISKAATAKAMTPVKKDAKVRAQSISDSAPWINTGALARSMAKKSKSYKASQTALTMVGARHGTVGYSSGLSHFSDGKPRESPVPRLRRPEKYIHLVMLGTKRHPQPNSIFGPNFVHPGARKQPFLEEALKSNKARVLQIYADEARAGIIREAMK